MKCPKCRFENPEDMIFCGECGAKIEIVCPECGFSNPLKFKFCGKCGHKLSLPPEAIPKDLSFDEKLAKIQKYLPKGLTEKILSQRDKIEGERKQVTVMFADMEGFTQLTERLGPEEAYTVMDQVYEILIHKVHDYEGTVNEMTGDGIRQKHITKENRLSQSATAGMWISDNTLHFGRNNITITRISGPV